MGTYSILKDSTVSMPNNNLRTEILVLNTDSILMDRHTVTKIYICLQLHPDDLTFLTEILKSECSYTKIYVS